MSVVQTILKINLQVLKLKRLSEKMEGISSVIVNLKQLTDNGFLGPGIANGIINELKANINEHIQSELLVALEEATIHALSMEVEVDTKIKNLTPIIAGLAVIQPPPLAYAANELVFLATLVDITNDLKTIQDNFKILNP